MLALAAVAAATAADAAGAAASTGPPSGSLLWSNVSEGGPGLQFASSAAPLGAAGDVLLIGTSASGAPAINRLHAATGEIVWSLALKGTGLDSVTLGADISLSVLADDDPVLVAWASVGGSTSFGGSTTVIGVDVETGSLGWTFHLPFDEMGKFSFSGGIFLGFGSPAGNFPAMKEGLRATAYTIEHDSATLLLNVSGIGSSASGQRCSSHQSRSSCLAQDGCGWDSLGGGCGAADWYPGMASLVQSSPVDGSSQATTLALLATVDGDDSAPGSIYALNTSDGTTLWKADNITATRTHAVGDVVVVAADTRPIYGQDTKISLLRGFSLSNGSLLWQRSSRKHGGDGILGVDLARACDMDCTLPCDLVAAGPFGAISPSSGEQPITHACCVSKKLNPMA